MFSTNCPCNVSPVEKRLQVEEGVVAKSRSIFLLALAALLACRAPGPSASGGGKAESQTRAAMEAASAAFHQALITNDAEKLFPFVAEDVVMMPPGEAVIRGKAAMRAWYAGFLSQFRTSSMSLTDREVIVGDSWAVEMGAYDWELAPVGGGAPSTERGYYMQVWKAQPDGQWRFAREIWNSSAPAAAPSGN